MPYISELTVDQRLSLSTAARHLAREFDGVFGEETIELFLATSYDQFADRAKFNHFLPLMAERFARQRLKALAKVEGKSADGLPVVLFLCVHNAGRSQMALGWFQRLAGDRAVAWSGGSEPGLEVNPAAVGAMAEVGIDITEEFPETLDRRDSSGCGRGHHHGLRRCLSNLPREAIRGLASRRPCRSGRRQRPTDPGRDRASGPSPSRLAGSRGLTANARPLTDLVLVAEPDAAGPGTCGRRLHDRQRRGTGAIYDHFVGRYGVDR